MSEISVPGLYTQTIDNGISYKKWMAILDKIVVSALGLSVHDLEDMMFRDSYDGGISPVDFYNEDVREAVMENYGREDEDLPVAVVVW